MDLVQILSWTILVAILALGFYFASWYDASYEKKFSLNSKFRSIGVFNNLSYKDIEDVVGKPNQITWQDNLMLCYWATDNALRSNYEITLAFDTTKDQKFAYKVKETVRDGNGLNIWFGYRF